MGRSSMIFDRRQRVPYSQDDSAYGAALPQPLNHPGAPKLACLTLRWALVAIVAGVIAALLNAGASAQEPPKFSGFLGNYSKLEARPDPALAEHYLYVRADVDWKVYTGLVIEPVKMFFKTGTQNVGFSPHDVEAVTEYFEASLLRELAGM